MRNPPDPLYVQKIQRDLGALGGLVGPDDIVRRIIDIPAVAARIARNFNGRANYTLPELRAELGLLALRGDPGILTPAAAHEASRITGHPVPKPLPKNPDLEALKRASASEKLRIANERAAAQPKKVTKE